MPSAAARRERRRQRKAAAAPEDEAKKYMTVLGLPSPPKNPRTGRTVPMAEAIKRVKNGEYGNDIKDIYAENSPRSVKRIMFLVGRDFLEDGNADTRNKMMLDLVHRDNGDEQSEPLRCFDLLLSPPCDRNLLHQTVGDENDKRNYANTGEATGKTYETVYGQFSVAILRYVQEEHSFSFVDKDEMEDLVVFLRFQVFGICFITAVVVFVSYLGQKVFKFKNVIYPLDAGQLIRSFEDEELYDHIVKNRGGDAAKTLKSILTRLASNENCRLLNDGYYDFTKIHGYDLEEKLKKCGPGLVAGFKCTKNFHAAWRNNDSWESDDTVGYMRFDMKSGQKFESVRGVFQELKSSRGRDATTKEEINLRVEKVKTKTARSPLFDPQPHGEETQVGSPPPSRKGGDKSAHVYSPCSSPDSIESSPRQQETVASREDNALLGDGSSGNQLGDESGGDGSESQVRSDRPTFVQENDETHAMVCVAGRKDRNGRLFLLLQNSWSRMPLVEVSLEYFMAAGADLSFVDMRHLEYFKKLTERDCLYQENKYIVADCSNAAYSPGRELHGERAI